MMYELLFLIISYKYIFTMNRPFLADPHFVRKAAMNKADEINTCIGCNQVSLYINIVLYMALYYVNMYYMDILNIFIYQILNIIIKLYIGMLRSCICR